MIDGEIDYSTYCREDLVDVLLHIDRQRYPLNHANAVRQLRAMPTPPPDPSNSASLPSAQAALSPRKPREQLVAEAAQFRFQPWIYVKYPLAHCAATGLVGAAFSEAKALNALRHQHAFDPAPLLHDPLAIAFGVAAALLVYVILAKRHPRGYFINGSIVSLVSSALELTMALLTFPALLKVMGARGLLSAVVTDLCIVALAGWMCGLAPHVHREPLAAEDGDR